MTAGVVSEPCMFTWDTDLVKGKGKVIPLQAQCGPEGG